jgi:hypothetical protein
MAVMMWEPVIGDSAAIRYWAEIGSGQLRSGPASYDQHQALEGAAGFAGTTESTSTTKQAVESDVLCWPGRAPPGDQGRRHG